MLNRKDHTGHNGCNTNPNRIVSRTAHAMSTANEDVDGKCSLPYKCNYKLVISEYFLILLRPVTNGFREQSCLCLASAISDQRSNYLYFLKIFHSEFAHYLPLVPRALLHHHIKWNRGKGGSKSEQRVCTCVDEDMLSDRNILSSSKARAITIRGT